MTKLRRAGLLLAVLALSMTTLLAVAPTAGAASELRTFEVTVENLTGGQLFTPPVVATHRGSTDIFASGAPASAALQGLAENGDVPGLVGVLGADLDVSRVAVGGSGPLAPGAAVTFTVNATKKGEVLSLAAMLICSNDGFAGLDSVPLPVNQGATRMFYADAYDAGTEINTEAYANLVPPCDGSGGSGMTEPGLAEGGVVGPHAGIVGGADLSPAVHGWTDPVAKVTVQRIDGLRDYRVTVTNLTTGQLLTPPVITTHRSTGAIFTSGTAASGALQQLAENGDVPGLIAALGGNSLVTRSGVVGSGPLAPGSSATARILGTTASKRLSVAAMLICSNDGFAGVDSMQLPASVSDTTTLYGSVYDAGTEINTEAYADLVPPCDGSGGSGMTDAGLAEGGVVGPHAGIVGGADLSPAIHGWTDPVIMVTIERLK